MKKCCIATYFVYTYNYYKIIVNGLNLEKTCFFLLGANFANTLIDVPMYNVYRYKYTHMIE